MTKPTQEEVAALVGRLRVETEDYSIDKTDIQEFHGTADMLREAADALEALAAEEGAEPVAWRLYHGKDGGDGRT